MIEIFEGRLGGGKTYSAVVRMVDHLRRGGLVCTNVEVIWPAIVQYVADMWHLQLEDSQLIKLTDEEIGLFHRHTPSGTPDLPVLVVVDEAHLNFNSRDWAQSSKELLAFLTQSRKVATDIIFISQSAENIDKQFRRLVQFVWRFRDLSKWKVPGLGIGWPFDQILACQFDYDGHTQLQRWFSMKDRRIFALYNTNSLLREFPRLQGATTKRTLKKTEKKEAPRMFKYVIIVMIAAAAVVAWRLKDGGPFGSKPKDTAEARQAVTPAPMRAIGPVPSADMSAKEKKPLGAYDIYDEVFRAFNSVDKTLRTDGGWYTAGEMSNKGFVMAVSDRGIARVQQPDGRPGWVVARVESVSSRQAVAGAPSSTPAPATPTPPPPKPVEKAPEGVTYGQRLDDQPHGPIRQVSRPTFRTGGQKL